MPRSIVKDLKAFALILENGWGKERTRFRDRNRDFWTAPHFSNEIKIKQAIIRSSNMKVAKFLLEGKISKIKKALKLLLRGVGVERNNSRDSREALFFKNNVNP